MNVVKMNVLEINKLQKIMNESKYTLDMSKT